MLKMSVLWDFLLGLWQWFWPPAGDWRWTRASPPDHPWDPLLLETRPHSPEKTELHNKWIL